MKSITFCFEILVLAYAATLSGSHLLVAAEQVDEKAVAATDAGKGEDAKTPNKPSDLGEEIKIFDGKSLDNWRIVTKFDFEQHGKIEVRDGSIHLEPGQPATGISIKTEIPNSNYEVSFSGRRVEGSDFFCGLTFPVKKQFCTLILGGWGGQIVGLSNIDSFNAAENNTTQVIDFKNGQWYKIRLRVTDKFIRIWLDGEQIIEVEADQHEFSIYWEQEPVRPLGLVTWYTHGELKDLKLNKLKAAGTKNDEATVEETTEQAESEQDPSD